MDNRELSTRFEAAAERLLAGHAPEPDAADLAVVLDWLVRLITRRYRTIDAEDIAQETVARIIALNTAPHEPISNPAGYITRIAQHLAVDAVRRQSMVSANTDLIARTSVPGASDDELAALLERSATQATIAAAIGLALQERDHMAVRIVTIWLDLADELGREPTSREVASIANASHTTVIKSLARFRAFLVRAPT